MSDSVISVEHLSKRYVLGRQETKNEGIRHVIEDAIHAPLAWFKSRGTRGKLQKEVFCALNDVSFDVKAGEVIGIIGRNGAGKSTLLKILSRITEPSTGRVRLKGRVASLLEVGTGFHPELTGRENIFLNGAILGMSRQEIIRKFDEIVDFAEIERFIDTPVKRYSSGMYVRLAFSVAAHLDPEILIVDEVLAVGDSVFQKKCLGKMEEARSRSRTVLFVSHNLSAVESFCSRAVVLDSGKVLFDGPCRESIEVYHQRLSDPRQAGFSGVADLGCAVGRSAQHPVQLKRLELFDGENRPLNGTLPAGGSLKALIYVELESASSKVDVELALYTLAGTRVCTAHSAYDPNWVYEKRVGEQLFVCEIPSLALVPGEYQIHVGLDIALTNVDSVSNAARLSVVSSDFYGTGIVPVQGLFMLPNRWSAPCAPAVVERSSAAVMVKRMEDGVALDVDELR